MNSVFVSFFRRRNSAGKIKDLVQKREEARSGKDFQKSDDLRAIIEKKGYILEDTKDGTKIVERGT